jgi:glyoxylate reductase
MSLRGLITEPIIDEIIEKLQAQFDVVIGNRGVYNSEDALVEAASDFDGMLTMLSNPVSASVLSASKRLRIVANYAVGYNNIDIEAAKKAGICVTNTPGALTEATADITWALILSVIRKLPASEVCLRTGKFDGWDPLGFLGYDLNGKTLGIIGLGRIGQAVARRALGFGMKVIYTNRSRADRDIEESLSATYVADYRELTRTCDVLSLNCPLTPESRHMINKDVLHDMKRSAIVINTGRGPLIDEAALAEALTKRWIAGAGLDVFELEPLVHPHLLKSPNAVLIPHIGSATWETRLRMGHLAANSIIHILNGGNPSELPNVLV